MLLKRHLAAAGMAAAALTLVAAVLTGQPQAPAPVLHPDLAVTTVPAGGVQAAARYGWGKVVAGDEFNYIGAPDPAKWMVYNGPGHAGKGVRSPNAWKIGSGAATVTGNAYGTTGGMAAKFAAQKYGRWEVRMRTSVRDPKYHPVLLLWPNPGTTRTCPEIDYAESLTDTTVVKFNVHYACAGPHPYQSQAARKIDTTQWHNYAVQWSPAGITGYIDGILWFTDRTPAHQPPGAMHQTLQLDWFPITGKATKPSWMQIDWVRVYK